MIKQMIDRWREISVEAKSSIAFVIATFLTRGISFITTPVFSRLMTTGEYGQVANYNSWISVLEPIAILGLTSAGVFSVGLNEYRDNRKQYMASMLGLCNVMTIITFGVIYGLRLSGVQIHIVSDSLMPLMVIHFLFSPAQIFLITKQRYEYKYKLAVFITVLSIALSQLFALYAVTWLDGDKAVNRLWGAELGAFIVYIWIYVYLIWSGRTYIKLSYWKSIFRFAMPLIPHYVAQHIMANSDRIMLVNIKGESAAGIYSLVANLGMIASIVWSSINVSLVSYTYEKMNAGDCKSIDKTVRIVLFPFAAVCIAVSLTAPEIVWILAPEEYHSGITIVPCFAMIAFVQALYNVFANIEFYYKKSVFIALSTVSATISNIGLNLLLIPPYGFVGASYATLISTIALVFFHYLGMQKCLGGKRIYSEGKIAMVFIICALGTFGCNLLYQNNVIRYLIIVIIMITVFFSREWIYAMWKKRRKK